MSLVYRSIFEDARSDVVAVVRSAVLEWFDKRGLDVDIPASGTTEGDAWRLDASQASEHEITATRVVLSVDEAPHRWTTVVVGIRSAEQTTIWVDVEWQATEPGARMPTLLAPSLVRSMVLADTCSIGPTPLRAAPTVLDAEGVPTLLGQLLDSQRRVPVILVTPDRYSSLELATSRAADLLRYTLGLAPVAVLDPGALGAAAEQMGPELQAPGGGVRVYMPGLSIPESDPTRHPYTGATLFARQTPAACARIQRFLRQRATSMDPPSVYRDRVAFLPGFPHHQIEFRDEQLLEELLKAEGERELLRKENTSLRDDLDFGALQLDDAEAQLDSALGRIRYLERRLRTHGDTAANEVTPTSTIPETAASCSEALELARQYLPLVEVGDTEITTQQLDAYAKSAAWGRKAWRAFRALGDYAETKLAKEFTGDFSLYCDNAPSGAATIPTTWVALQESESTDSNPAYRSARTFPVPDDVNDDGQIYMCAHIKIEQGGRPAPRIHFFDDTAGPSKRVYVGYFGEHLPTNDTN